MSYSSTQIVEDYAKLRTIPALMTALFALFGLYQFGGMNTPTFQWLNYTLTYGHAMVGSLGVYIIAFMSSETRRFEDYSTVEKGLIAAGLLLIFGQQHIATLADFIATNQPTSGIVAYLITIVSWGVAVR